MGHRKSFSDIDLTPPNINDLATVDTLDDIVDKFSCDPSQKKQKTRKERTLESGYRQMNIRIPISSYNRLARYATKHGMSITKIMQILVERSMPDYVDMKDLKG